MSPSRSTALRLCFIYGHEFAEKVIGNLCSTANFCQVCGLTCDYCRLPYQSFAGDIYGAYNVSAAFPSFVEDPERFMPENIPRCDIVVAVGLHPDLLFALSKVTKKSEARALIVPIEDRKWCPPAVKRELADELNRMNIEYAFPKPFCSLEPSGQPVLEKFAREYRIGRPELEVKVKRRRVSDAHVVTSAPCGSTWYIAQRIKGKRLSEIDDAVAVAHHSYPCTASMETDPELSEPILHKAGHTIRQAVKDAIGRAKARSG